MIYMDLIDGKHVPRIKCDDCAEVIAPGDEAIVRIMSEGEIRFVHKNIDGRTCDDGHGAWIALDVFFYQLTENTRIDVEAGRGASRML